jgi:ribosomal protein S18 acetylase RimI-like enzyme
MTSYREAVPKDDSSLLKLMNSTGMPGIIQLMTTRAPSFFDLISKRGLSKVIVAEKKDQIVGAICATHETAYINKIPTKLFYISDFRVDYTHRNQGIGLQLTNKAVDYMEEQDADFVFLNVSKGNKRPFVFFGNRKHYPDFQNIGIFNIYQFLGSKKKTNNEFRVEKIILNKEIIDFLNDFYKSNELAPVIKANQFQDTTIFKVEEKGKLIGVMCIADYNNCKQHIVIKLPWYLRLFISIMNLIRTIAGNNLLPSTNQPIKMLYIKYLAVKRKDRNLIKSLIRTAQNEVYSKSYSFVSLGLHEKDPLIQRLPGFFRITFNSVGMLVTMKNNQKGMDLVKKGIPYKDFSTV